MAKVSVNILTKNRAGLLKKTLLSVAGQTYQDYEVVVVNDGSIDDTELVLNEAAAAILNLKIINHKSSLGITKSRQEALAASAGEYIAILDDDDEWINKDKLAKQVKFLDDNRDYVLVGGGMRAESGIENQELKIRPKTDKQIRRTMLLRNNFFTSTVMFRRASAVEAGGYLQNGADLAEDYDLWLRLGELGKMHNFSEIFTAYRQTQYNSDKRKQFFYKQLKLIGRHKTNYPYYYPAAMFLRLRRVF